MTATGTVLLVTNIPTPYRIPLSNAVAEAFERSGFKLKVAFAASGYARRNRAFYMDQCRFAYEILPSTPFHIGKSESASFTYQGLWRALRREKSAGPQLPGFSRGEINARHRNGFNVFARKANLSRKMALKQQRRINFNLP